MIKRKRFKTVWKFISILLLLIIIYLGYYQLFYVPKQVRSDKVKDLGVLMQHGFDVWAAKFSNDGRFIISGSVDSTIVITDIANKKPVQIFKHPAGVTYVSISGDNKYIVSGSYDGKMRLWEFNTGKLLAEHDAGAGIPRSVTINSNGTMVAGGFEDGSIILWETAGNGTSKKIKAHNLTVWDVKFSMDDRSFASGSFDRKIKLWDAASGKLIKEIADHEQGVVALAYSRDGKYLASTSDDGTVKIRNAVTGNVLQTLIQPEHPQGVSFSANGSTVVTSGRDKTTTGEFLQELFGNSEANPGVSMRLWEVSTGKLLQTMRGHANDVNDVDFSRDGTMIVSASSDKTVKLWQVKK